MATSQNMKKGTRSGRIARPEPQSDWDSFSLTTGIPKDKKGIFPLPTGTTTSHRTELGVEGTAQEGRTVEALSPQQQIPQRRGRPRKNKEAGETRISDEPRTRPIVEQLLMRVVRLEPLEGTSRESGRRMRRMDVHGSNDQETSQQLKQAKLAIVELYQENRELRQQLATKITEASTTQGREGNMTWLKRQLREAQDTIVQLREAQWLSEERYAKHSRECEATEEIAHSSRQRAKETRLAEFIPVFTNRRKILTILKETSPKTFFHFNNGHDCLQPLVAHTSPNK
jgi:hypothetical protein